ncbi:hypothetical protein [Haloarcula laminariae]|uniref:hypothetical protein n=1 Tax=Haloarcula laminariae TaxID=2961577 RepID=UPI0024056271|nr:hypothetical protein [Halomicroarcula sp. FL173]
MGEKYDFVYFRGGVEVETEEGGNQYVARGRLSRLLWMVYGVVFAALLGFLTLFADGLFSRAFWVVGIASLLGGVVAEPILGGRRSDVKDVDDNTYVELIPATRGMAVAATMLATWMGVTMIFQLVNPRNAAQYARTTGWILELTALVPFGEVIFGALCLLMAWGLSSIARSGHTEIVPASE